MEVILAPSNLPRRYVPDRPGRIHGKDGVRVQRVLDWVRGCAGGATTAEVAAALEFKHCSVVQMVAALVRAGFLRVAEPRECDGNRD